MEIAAKNTAQHSEDFYYGIFYTINKIKGTFALNLQGIYKKLSDYGLVANLPFEDWEIYRRKGVIYETLNQNQMNRVIDQILSEEAIQVQKLTVGVQQPHTIIYNRSYIKEQFYKYGIKKITDEQNYTLLPYRDIFLYRDTRTKKFMFFKNGFVTITKDSIDFSGYETFDKVIHKQQHLNRNINIIDIDSCKKTKAHDFNQFLHYISASEYNAERDGKQETFTHKVDEVETRLFVNPSKIQYLYQLLGYLLHDYKQRGLTDWMPIFCDDEHGGSGKGLLIDTIIQCTNVCKVDCSKSKQDDFSQSDLTRFTRVKVFEDMSKSFNLRNIYNEITELTQIRTMRKNPIIVPYQDSWKTAATSNYIVKGSKDSDFRRQRIFDLYPYFGKKKTVAKHFGQVFFRDWVQADWDYFYNLMFRCVQQWLMCNYNCDFTSETYQQVKIERQFNHIFIEYMEEKVEKGVFHKNKILYGDFIKYDIYRNNGQQNSKWVYNKIKDNPNGFGRMLRDYLKETGRTCYKNSNRTETFIGKNKGDLLKEDEA